MNGNKPSRARNDVRSIDTGREGIELTSAVLGIMPGNLHTPFHLGQVQKQGNFQKKDCYLSTYVNGTPCPAEQSHFVLRST